MNKLIVGKQGGHLANAIDEVALSSHRVFLLVFAWSLIAGLLIQWVVLPALPGLHAGHGLMKGGDPVWYHREAVRLASLMQQGWQVWELRPQGNAPIGITAAAYFLVGIREPWVVMPINAALFALAAVSLYGIFTSFASKSLAFMATLPFVLFPSAALIYGQIHKDVFSIAGTLLIVFVWVQFVQRVESGWRSVLGRVVLTALGCLLVWVVRPYLVQPLMAASVLSVLLLGIMTGRGRGVAWWVGILLCLLVQVGYNKYATAPTSPSARAAPSAPVAPSALAVPTYLERAVANLNAARIGLVVSDSLAGSNIDSDIRFDSLAAVVSYVPRAFQVALLAPFPAMWVSDGVSPGSGVMRFISGLEMAGSYVLLIGVGLLLYRLKVNRSALLVAIFMTLVLILVLGLVVGNVGTLYRMRYGSWQLLNGLGVVGWVLMLQARRESANE
jgi:hypothetical protein